MEYNLCLQRDTNSPSGSTQWYYFRVGNRRHVGPVRFNIVNLVKPYSSYEDGLRVLVFRKGVWERGCSDISYRRNTLPRNSESLLFYYSLSFTYEFERPNQEVSFAHCYPYSYSRLQLQLAEWERSHPSTLHRRRMANTALSTHDPIADNSLELLTIANPASRPRPAIFVTARVHPGESPSSYVLEGFLQALLGTGPASESLRNEFVWKVVPMLNPDGVIHGNYRCSATGVDLNRCWKEPSKQLSPEVLAVKSLVRQTANQKAAFFDLHAHSKKRGIFAYGCMSKSNPYAVK